MHPDGPDERHEHVPVPELITLMIAVVAWIVVLSTFDDPGM
ncbi:MAG: hypothetical protein ABIO99_00765 [Candidatus Limnocylindria bacterium]